MAEIFWEDNFEWLDQEPISDGDAAELSIEEMLERERKLARLMAGHKGRWIILRNQVIISSTKTLSQLLEREEKVATADAILKVPEHDFDSFYYDQAA